MLVLKLALILPGGVLMNVPLYCGTRVLLVPETDGCFAVWRDLAAPKWRVLRLVSHGGSRPYWFMVTEGRDKTAAMASARMLYRGESE
jgi:hypothetical protein